MTITRLTFVRPVAVAVIAAGLAGCAVLSPAEPSASTSAQPAQTEAAQSDTAQSERAADALGADATVDQALDGDEDDEEVGDPAIADGVHDPDWALPFIEQPGPSDPSLLPVTPSPLVDLLPGTSPLWVHPSQVSEQLARDLSVMTEEAALGVAVATLHGMTDLVNSGALEPFATAASVTCRYCLGKLHAADRIYSDEEVSAEPWLLQFDAQARTGLISGPHHVAVELTGHNTGLFYGRENQLHIGDLSGPTLFRLDMKFDKGQWWVMGVSTEPL